MATMIMMTTTMMMMMMMLPSTQGFYPYAKLLDFGLSKMIGTDEGSAARTTYDDDDDDVDDDDDDVAVHAGILSLRQAAGLRAVQDDRAG
jgi:hypothetical protein